MNITEERLKQDFLGISSLLENVFIVEPPEALYGFIDDATIMIYIGGKPDLAKFQTPSPVRLEKIQYLISRCYTKNFKLIKLKNMELSIYDVPFKNPVILINTGLLQKINYKSNKQELIFNFKDDFMLNFPNIDLTTALLIKNILKNIKFQSY